jgi:diguanylate cyclase (GGDEF)-like protein/PAS domain S-box-containing protein
MIAANSPFCITDTSRDPVLAENALVQRPPALQFCAGFPVPMPEGMTQAMLFVVDTRVREADSIDMAGMADFAALVGSNLKRRREVALQTADRRSLDEEVRFLSRVLDHIEEPIISLDRSLRIVYFNKPAARMCGIDSREAIGKSLAKILDYAWEKPEQRGQALKSLATGGVWRGRNQITVLRNGNRLIIDSAISVVHNQKGERIGYLGILHDNTERAKVEEALWQAERNYRSIFENAFEGIFQATPDGRFLNANAALARIYGYDSPEDLMQGLTNIRHQLYVDPVRRAEFIKLMRESDSITEFEAQVYRKDGSIVWISESARAVRDASGKLLYYEGMVADISGRKTLEAEQARKLQEAMERADRDPLTGLFNHRCFHKRLQQEADRTAVTGEPMSIALIDLDNFKFFNDVYGHAVGDDVLRQVAAALGNCCRSEDVLARFGGDEFALLMPGYGPEDAVKTAAMIDKCLDGMGYRPPGYNAVIPFSLSVGVATLPDDGLTRFDLIEIADARLRHVKNGGDEDDYVDRLRASLRDQVEGFSMLDALVKAVDTKDRYTRRHSEDVMVYSVQIARELRLAPAEVRAAEVAGLLHDVGKIGVPDSILRKPGKLTDADMQAIKQHPMMGAIIVGAVPGFEDALDAVRHHHERWDGAGYPFGLRGQQIPLLARVMAVADAYSAMTTDRPYRKGMPAEKALRVLEDGSGVQWDPECVQAFVRARRAEIQTAEAA